MNHSIEILEHRIAPATVIAAISNNEFLQFDSDTPGTTKTINISGIGAGETLVGIDYRPATGGLYGFTVDGANHGQLYLIDVAAGTATAIGSQVSDASLTLSSALSYGFDFNPTADRIRVVTSGGDNFRLNPFNGTLAGIDPDLSFMAPATGPVAASAYDRDFAGAAMTTLYGIDVGADRLILQGGIDGTPSPNGGVITNVGSLGVNATDASFDIANGSGTAFAALTVGGSSGLYTINLTTGAATLVGQISPDPIGIAGIAVATEQVHIVNSKTATYTDVDGDLVTVKVTKGTLTPSLFELSAGPNGGAYLRSLNLTDPSFAGTNLTITAKAGSGGGDQLASVGYINAVGNDLGVVKINGNLNEIDAGDNAGGVALKSLSVYSFGAIPLNVAITDGTSSLIGSLPKLSVKRDFRNAVLSVNDPSVEGVGTLGSVAIGGSFVGGATASSGQIIAEAIGSVRIGGNLEGGIGTSSGQILADTTIASVSIGGSLIAGPGPSSALIATEGAIGSVKIGGNIEGSSASGSAQISGFGGISSVVIGGSLHGGSGTSGRVLTGSAAGIGTVQIKGDLQGGGGDFSGSIQGGNKIQSVTIGGSLLGGTNEDAGTISTLSGEIGSVKIKGSILGTSNSTAYIRGTTIGTVQVGGDVIGSGLGSALITATGTGSTIDRVTIGGSMIGTNESSAAISGDAIGTVIIKGSVNGESDNAGAIFADHSLGSVSIGGNLTGVTFSSGTINVAEGGAGSINIGGTIKGGSILTSGDIAAINVGGDLVDSFSTESAIAALSGTISKLTIKGSVEANFNGTNIGARTLGAVTIGRDLSSTLIQTSEGGIGSISVRGSVHNSTINSQTTIGSVSVGRDVQGSFYLGIAILASSEVGSIKIGGSLEAGQNGANITARTVGSIVVGGEIAGTSANRIAICAIGTQESTGTKDLAVGGITVGGRVENVDVLAGYNGLGLVPTNADAQIGKVSVGGDWITSNLVAGISSSDSVFGNSDDAIIPEMGQVNDIVASIASIAIKGSVLGTFGGTDGYAFTAEEIKSVSISGVKLKLQAGSGNDNVSGIDPKFVLGATQDVRVREISLV